MQRAQQSLSVVGDVKLETINANWVGKLSRAPSDHCILRTHSQPPVCSAFCSALSVHPLHHSSSSTSLPFHPSTYVPMCPFLCILSLPHWHPEAPHSILPSPQTLTRVSPAPTLHSLRCPAPPLCRRTAPAPTPTAGPAAPPLPAAPPAPAAAQGLLSLAVLEGRAASVPLLRVSLPSPQGSPPQHPSLPLRRERWGL